jgi:hypothetical protein
MENLEAKAEGRHIPEDLKRQLLVEAGHRCAIPTCRQYPTEFAHIEPFAKVRKHTFANLIVLCVMCHTRYDCTKEIDRKAMLQYKANLGVLNSRYGEYERRVLRVFGIEQRDIDEFTDGPYFVLPRGRELDLWYLIQDRMIEPCAKNGRDRSDGIIAGDVIFQFTAEGRELIRRLRNAQSLG